MFTVEDGTVVTGANSYASVADADSYHSDRGNSVWADLSTAEKEAALIKATDYIEAEYIGRWKGSLVEDSQPLEWPRIGVDPFDNTIPAKLEQAVFILALEAATTELNPNLERGGMIKREKVDVIETEYMDGASGRTKRPMIDGLLRSLLSGSRYNAKVVRV